jgi:membrane protein
MPTAMLVVRSTYRWLRELYDDLDRARTFGLAAQTAFWFFLSLIPLLAVAGLVAARLTLANWTELAPVLGNLPTSTQLLIRRELDAVSQWRGGTIGITGAGTFVWLASTGFDAIFQAFEVQSNRPRSWWRRRLLAIGTCLGLALVVPALAVLGLGLERVTHGFRMDFWTRVARFALSFAIAAGYHSALYWVGIPSPARTLGTILPGALAAVGLQAAMSFGYALYLSRFTHQAVYGAGLGIVAATLMALYLSALSLLIGAAVTRKLAARRAAPERAAGSS